MKRILISTLVALSASPALATDIANNHGSYAGAGAEQQQRQDAYGGTAVSNSSGGHAASGASANSFGSDVNVTGGNTRALGLTFAPPVASSRLPAATASCALSSSRAIGVAWNFVSHATSEQRLDSSCVLEIQADRLERQCRYRSAALVRARVMQMHGIDLPIGDDLVDLSPADCSWVALGLPVPTIPPASGEQDGVRFVPDTVRSLVPGTRVGG